MQTGWQKTEKGRWTWAINYPPWESICSTGAVDQWWHCDTHSFLYSFVGAPQSNNSFLVFFFPLVSLSLSEVVTTDLLSAKVRLCVKDRHYITSAVNKVKWCYAHAIRLSFTETEKTALKHSWSEWGLLSWTPPCLPCLLLRNDGDFQIPAFKPSDCSTIPTVRKWYSCV